MSIINTLYFDLLDSTSTYAKQNAASLPLPSLIIANGQTAGRGRKGNSFYSPKDTGLYMTLLIESPENCDLLTPAAAVSVCRVLEKFGIDAKIKWVNDIFVDGLKTCGILCERYAANGRAVVAIGTGINLTTEKFPDDLKTAGSINLECDKVKLAREIADEMIFQLKRNDTVEEYRKRLFILGKKIGYTVNGIDYTAEAVDINEHCNLTVKKSDGSFEILSSGEISIKI